MKVLFWMSTSFNTTSRHLLVAIIDQLCQSGHEVTVLKKRFDDEKEDLPEDLNNRGIRYISVDLKRPRKSSFISRYLNDLQYMRKCNRFLVDTYDAVFVQSSNVAGVSFRKLAKHQRTAIKTFNVQDAFPENAAISNVLNSKGIPYRILKRIQKVAYRDSDHIITISEDIKDHLVEEWEIDPNKINVIYNWSYRDDVYDEKEFSEDAVSHIYQNDLFRVVYAGNIGVMQNVDVIIEAAKILKEENNIWFYIIGNGLYRDQLIARAKSYGVTNISFLPMQPAELAPSIYGLADVNIIPLKKCVFRTALPSKTATCLACQRPIIFVMGTDSVFAKRVMNETGCLLVDSDDSQRLASSIKDIVDRKLSVETKLFFEENMSKTRNSLKYTEIITRRPKSD